LSLSLQSYFEPTLTCSCLALARYLSCINYKPDLLKICHNRRNFLLFLSTASIPFYLEHVNINSVLCGFRYHRMQMLHLFNDHISDFLRIMFLLYEDPYVYIGFSSTFKSSIRSTINSGSTFARRVPVALSSSSNFFRTSPTSLNLYHPIFMLEFYM
jgi:hypothetical protein